MADNVLVDNVDEPDYTVSTDEAASGHVQRVKLTQSADGSDTHIQADADGLLVNLGTNNDVTISGTVTVAEPVTVDGAVTVSSTDLDIRNLDVAQDDVRVGGMAANDAAVADNPVLQGGRASDVVPTAVSADGDAVWRWLDRRGAAKTVLVDDAGDSAMDGTNNALRVNVVAGAGAGVSHVDSAAFTVTSDDVVPIAGYRDDTSPDTLAEGEAGAIRATTNRALHVNLRDASGAELAVGGGTQYDEDTAATAAEKITMAGVVRKDAAASLVDTDGDRTELQVDSTGALRVTESGSVTAYVEGDTDASIEGVAMLWEDAADTLRAVSAAKPLPVDTEFPSGVLTGQLDAGALSTEILAIEPGIVFPIGDGTFPIEIQSSGLDNLANTVNELVTAALGYVFDGTAWDRLRGDSIGGAFAQGPVAADGVAAGNPLYTGGRASAAAPADVSADGDVVPRWHLRNGAAATVLTAAGALIGGDATNGLDVDVTRLPSLPAGSNNIGDVDVLTLPSIPAGSNNIGDVDVLTLPSLPAGSNNIGDVDIASVAAGTVVEVIGDVAHDAAAPANPVVVGAQMETIADSAPGTRAGTDGDAVKLASTDGAIFVAGAGPQAWSYHDNETAGSLNTDTTVHAAPGAGLSLYVTDISFSIGAATASSLFLEEGATTVFGPLFLEAVSGRGVSIHFRQPKKITANTALTVTNTGATTFSIDIQGFIAPG